MENEDKDYEVVSLPYGSTTVTDSSTNTSNSTTTKSKGINPNIQNEYENFKPVIDNIKNNGYAATFLANNPNPLENDNNDEADKVARDNNRRRTYQALHGILSTLADTAIAFGGGNVYKRNYDYIDKTDKQVTNDNIAKNQRYQKWLKDLNDAIIKDKELENDYTKEFLRNAGYSETTTTGTTTTIGGKTSVTSGARMQVTNNNKGGNGSGSDRMFSNGVVPLNTKFTNIDGKQQITSQQWRLKEGKNEKALVQAVLNEWIAPKGGVTQEEKIRIANQMNTSVEKLDELISRFTNESTYDEALNNTDYEKLRSFISVALGNQYKETRYKENGKQLHVYTFSPKLEKIRKDYLEPDEDPALEAGLINDITEQNQ